MSSTITYVTIPISQRLAEELPSDPATRAQVLELGLRQWWVRQALEAYRRGQGSLGYAARQAGVSIREIIPLAYAYGLSPKVDPDWLTRPLTLEQAARL